MPQSVSNAGRYDHPAIGAYQEPQTVLSGPDATTTVLPYMTLPILIPFAAGMTFNESVVNNVIPNGADHYNLRVVGASVIVSNLLKPQFRSSYYGALTSMMAVFCSAIYTLWLPYGNCKYQCGRAANQSD